MSKQIAVIGAGMSGVACAYNLVRAGAYVKVFDKGRRLGGRLSTRIQDGLAFNHGAPYFIAEKSVFKNVMEQLVAAGSATQDSSGFVGKPHMNDVLGPLTIDFDVYQSVEINILEKRSNNWFLTSVDGQFFGPFDVVVICIPAPQALNLVKMLKPDWAVGLDTVSYDPCLTMMVAFEDKIPTLESAAFEGKNIIAKQIWQSGGQLRATSSARWVIHASQEWSACNLEREREDIAQDLFQEFLSVNGLNIMQVALLQGHRWRYARVKSALGVPYLWDAEEQIGLAGDWCIGPNVEDAYESGANLAKQVYATLQVAPK